MTMTRCRAVVPGSWQLYEYKDILARPACALGDCQSEECGPEYFGLRATWPGRWLPQWLLAESIRSNFRGNAPTSYAFGW